MLYIYVCVCVYNMFTAAALLKFGMCGGHINALKLWFVCKRTYYARALAHPPHPYTHKHTVGCFRDYRDWRILVWLINGNINFIVRIYYNKTFDSVFTPL